MNFALIMFLLLVVTGAIWLLDYFLLRARRPTERPEPWWIEYPKSFFPVILVVFLLRSFLVEPFKIPSGSMLPTLLVGDFILVNKYTYGIRLPVIDRKIISINFPKRGEVMVFRYPENPSLDYIKRVVGLPGAAGLPAGGAVQDRFPAAHHLRCDRFSRAGDGAAGCDRRTESRDRTSG